MWETDINPKIIWENLNSNHIILFQTSHPILIGVKFLKPAVFKLTKFSRMPVIQGLKLLVCWCECKDQYHCHRSQLPQTLFNRLCPNLEL